MDGAERIARERRRQVEEEGFTSEEDDARHDDDDLAVAAAMLVLANTAAWVEDVDGGYRGRWMRELVEKHRGNPIRRLEIAGALIAAAIDYELRSAARETSG